MRLGTRRFNLICHILALGWLLVGMPVREHFRPSADDFDQYFTAGVAVWESRWDLLYPVPIKNSPRNPGMLLGSRPKPELMEMMRQRNAEGVSSFFIQFPPVALFYVPLGTMKFWDAHYAWIVASCIAAAIIVLQASRIAEICFGRATRASGIIALVIAFSHLFYRSIRTSNVSMIVGALIGWAVIDLFRNRNLGGGVAIALSALIKYFGAMLVPLALAVGRWRAVVWSMVITAGLFLLTVAISGPAVFRECFTVIVPRLWRTENIRGNQSIHGVVARLTNSLPLETSDRIFIGVFNFITLASVLLAVFHRRKTLLSDPPSFFAAAACLLSWMMIFAPICWSHYIVYLVPVWGWLAWEFCQGGWRRAAVIGIIGLSWLLVGYATVQPIPELINIHPLYSIVLTLLLGLSRLVLSGDDDNENDSDVSTSAEPTDEPHKAATSTL